MLSIITVNTDKTANTMTLQQLPSELWINVLENIGWCCLQNPKYRYLWQKYNDIVLNLKSFALTCRSFISALSLYLKQASAGDAEMQRILLKLTLLDTKEYEQNLHKYSHFIEKFGSNVQSLSKIIPLFHKAIHWDDEKKDFMTENSAVSFISRNYTSDFNEWYSYHRSLEIFKASGKDISEINENLKYELKPLLTDNNRGYSIYWHDIQRPENLNTYVPRKYANAGKFVVSMFNIYNKNIGNNLRMKLVNISATYCDFCHEDSDNDSSDESYESFHEYLKCKFTIEYYCC